ncbi:MAG: hypothetical protein WBD31_13655 [Rubripirellula sp.]
MSQTTVEISGDARDLEATFDRIDKRQEQQEAGFKSTAKVSQDSSRQIAAANESAANKGAATYNRILKELRKHGPEGKAQAKQIEKHLQETGQAGRRSMQSIVDELGTFDDEAAKVARNASNDLEKVGDKGKEAFGPSAIAQLKSFAMGWIGVQTAVATVTRAIDAMRQAQQGAVDSLDQTKDGNSRLLQVSDSASEFEERRGQADDLAAQYGITRQASRDLIFNADSSDFLDTADFIAQNSQVLGVEAQSTVAGQIPKLFANDPITGEEAINATLAAAQTSRLNFEEVARSLPSAAASAAPAGATADETLALLSVLADKFKSGETAADRIASIGAAVSLDQGEQSLAPEEVAKKNAAEDARLDNAKKKLRTLTERQADAQLQLDRSVESGADVQTVTDRRTKLDRATRAVGEFDQTELQRREIETGSDRESFAGLGIIEPVRRLQALSDEERRNFLGESKELNEAYNAIADSLPVLGQSRTKILEARNNSGTDAAPVNQKRAIADADPRLAALRNKQAAENREEIEREKALSQREANRQAERAREKATGYERGDSALVVEGTAQIQQARDTIDDTGRGVFETLGNSAFGALSSDSLSALSDDDLSDDQRRRAEGLNFAGVKLQGQRDAGQEVGLSASDVQTYLSTIAGDFVDPSQITDDVIRKVNNEIGSAANALPSDTVARNRLDLIYRGPNDDRQRGTLDNLSSVDELIGGRNTDDAAVAQAIGGDRGDLSATTTDGVTITPGVIARADADSIADNDQRVDTSTIAAAQTVTQETIRELPASIDSGANARDEVLDQTRQTNELLRENNQLMRDAAKRDEDKIETARQTADNTRPRPTNRDPAAIQRASAAATDARASK